MHKLIYAFFAILAVGLIYVGLQSNSPSDLPAPAAEVELSVEEEAIVVEEPSPPLDADLKEALAAVQDPQFPNFDEIPDPTEAGGRLTTWWQAIQNHPGCRKNADAYDVALEEFLKWLYKMLAERKQQKG